jgi:hypothetical protein
LIIITLFPFGGVYNSAVLSKEAQAQDTCASLFCGLGKSVTFAEILCFNFIEL